MDAILEKVSRIIKLGKILILLILAGCVYPAILNCNTSWEAIPQNVQQSFLNHHKLDQLESVEKSIFRKNIVAYHFFLSNDDIIEILPDGYYIGLINATPPNVDKQKHGQEKGRDDNL